MSGEAERNLKPFTRGVGPGTEWFRGVGARCDRRGVEGTRPTDSSVMISKRAKPHRRDVHDAANVAAHVLSDRVGLREAVLIADHHDDPLTSDGTWFAAAGDNGAACRSGGGDQAAPPTETGLPPKSGRCAVANTRDTLGDG